MKPTASNVLLVFPRFNPHSFWSLRGVLDVVRVRCPCPPLGLITLAALLPQTWNFRLIDRNAEELTDDDLDWADVVMTGGMLPQQPDTLHVIELCRARNIPVAVGGPDATSSPHVYARANFRVLGETEAVIEQLTEVLTSGATTAVIEAEKYTADVTKTPIPRFDLLKTGYYRYIGVQFSRGCPFNCEFCDIIELYGRVPRTKTNEQMLAELDALHRLGYRGHVDFVDDNLIGNKKSLRRFLPALKQWQKERGYPFKFSTEASINLSDDAELLRMMREANFFMIFVGIESPNPDTLVLMQKKQNTRRSLAESIHRIYAAGIVVIGGFVMGFDDESDGVSQSMIECVKATSIPLSVVGLLIALPNTQLSRRLKKEGRLFENYEYVKIDDDYQCSMSMNFTPVRSRRDILADYTTVLQSIYHPAAYFERVRRVGRMLDRSGLSGQMAFKWSELIKLARVVWHMGVRSADVRRQFWATLADCAWHNPRALEQAIYMMAFYLHHGRFSRVIIAEIARYVEAIDAGKWKAPPVMPAAAAARPRPVAPLAAEALPTA
ncbi:MAG TPA: radical SAM protein [Xanthobacteraceae bacterium]|jgi:radical SAM superfamily enzyme YgiQ (UPF0313 family)